MTPRRSRRSEGRQEAAAEVDTDGAQESCPFTHCPQPRSLRASSPSPSPESGPSISGARLPDLGTAGPLAIPRRLHRRRGRSRSSITGDGPRRGLSDLDLDLPRARAGVSPLATSSLSAEKNPCFFSILPSPLVQNPKR
ncbi:hypothetical protein BHE74_00021474 [Ensete ventricosum]|nr:hypothetical protein GW17_00039416 [Ensete ventricosum]RWW70840.1 hypothetical protein BHE74_00021474 [Ensete ventricosum]RZS06964.1 hypothetical protein BHM03_00037723 [Ensete ventricosum]